MTCLLSRFAFLTFVGFAAFVLIGPGLGLVGVGLGLMGALLGLAIAVLCVTLPFAFIGLLIWLPFYVVGKFHSKRERVGQWQQTQGRGMGQWQSQGSWGQCQGQGNRPMVQPAVNRCVGAVRQTADATAASWHRCHRAGRSLAGVILETICGAAVLGMLGGLIGSGLPHRQMEGYVLTGIALGALIGFMIGVANHAPSHAVCQDRPRET